MLIDIGAGRPAKETKAPRFYSRGLLCAGTPAFVRSFLRQAWRKLRAICAKIKSKCSRAQRRIRKGLRSRALSHCSKDEEKEEEEEEEEDNDGAEEEEEGGPHAVLAQGGCTLRVANFLPSLRCSFPLLPLTPTSPPTPIVISRPPLAVSRLGTRRRPAL